MELSECIKRQELDVLGYHSSREFVVMDLIDYGNSLITSTLKIATG